MALPLPFGGAGRRTPGRGWAQVVAHPRLAIILACVLGWLAWRTFRGIGSTGGVVSQSGVLKLPLSTALFASVVLPPNDAPGARPRVLVTGGAGYIGSHTCVELVGAGYAVTIVDNLGNAQEAVVGRIRALVSAPEAVTFVQGDVRDEALLARVLSAAKHIAVIHFAAFKAVGESIGKPLDYYQNNVGGLNTILAAVKAYGIKEFVFSSSATVYGTAEPPFTELTQIGVGISNPYGQTKYIAELILRDFSVAEPSVAIACLRYFNPVGAHPSGTIGEDPRGIPNNLMPYIQRVSVGKLPSLTIHGSKYDTPDGTAQRDYIHVVDLAKGHVKAIAWLTKRAGGGLGGMEVFNLGTGVAYSVLDMVNAFKKASGRNIPYTIGPPRAGDMPAVWADASKAATVLDWQAELGIDRMAEDCWRWISNLDKLGAVGAD